MMVSTPTTGSLKASGTSRLASGARRVVICEPGVTFADLIEGKPVPADPPPATFADGVAVMRVLDAIRRSARDHEWVEID